MSMNDSESAASWIERIREAARDAPPDRLLAALDESLRYLGEAVPASIGTLAKIEAVVSGAGKEP